MGGCKGCSGGFPVSDTISNGFQELTDGFRVRDSESFAAAGLPDQIVIFREEQILLTQFIIDGHPARFDPVFLGFCMFGCRGRRYSVL